MRACHIILISLIEFTTLSCSKSIEDGKWNRSENPCENQKCTLQTNWGSTDTLRVVTENIFAIWWDPKTGDHSGDVPYMFEKLMLIRNDCLDNLGMSDPPNPSYGFYYNVYIHYDEENGEQDLFPNGWAYGQGTDPFGLPYLTVPHGGIYSPTLYHEGFHIFQYDSNSPGFSYSGDTMWYIESSAQWYMANYNNDRETYVEAGAILGNPQLALWHSFANGAPQDPIGQDGRAGWMYGVRQYGMHTFLHYLTDVKGVDRSFITDGFYAETNLSPQEYLYTKIGPNTFRSHFADWAADNVAGMNYLTKEQVERALLEITLAGDWNLFRPSVWYSENSGTDGEWVGPPNDLSVRGWAYNVFNITNSLSTNYSFELQGDSLGSQNAPAYFIGRIVVMNNVGPKYYEMEMSDALNGKVNVSVISEDSKIFLVVASVPEYFESYQHYPYKVKISVGE